jgi:deoxyribodipyrimidine photolyase-related protein
MKITEKKRILRLVLGDQLNIHHSWLKKKSDTIIYVMMEMRQETDYVHHHIQKIIGFFLSMRAFSQDLLKNGHRVEYFKITDPENQQDLYGNLEKLIRKYKVEHFEYQLPDEYRLEKQLKNICQEISITSRAVDSEHFLTTRDELEDFFKGKKRILMENFYRHMRKKHDVLMADGEPLGGNWNFDKENRKKLPADFPVPDPKVFKRNVTELKRDIDSAKIKYIGRLDPTNYEWPVTRKEVLQLFDHFLKNHLAHFGSYQDALTDRSWSVFHSRISFGLNSKLVHPLEIIRKTEKF